LTNQGKLLKTYLSLRAYLGWSLKPMAQNYPYLFIAILCAKISSVYKPLGSSLKFFVTFFSRDIADGGSCKFDPQTNLPNENCTFVPVGDNSGIRSSYMSLPSLENVSKI